MDAARRSFPLPDIEGDELLTELALNLRWSWNHSTDDLWARIDPELWASTHNPWIILRTASWTKLKSLAGDPEFRAHVEKLSKTHRQSLTAPTWFRETYPHVALSAVAYFSMEFMLSEALPIYSGGLGNVAGDQLKAASDLGVPVVGIGLLYQEGYFRQVLDAQGAQRAFYPHNAPEELPIVPVRDQNGEWVRLSIPRPGYMLRLRAWQAQVGRVTLYLLDSNDPTNKPADRGITSELYGGGPEVRLLQEMVLGIGGWRLLKMLGICPEVCHLNEGHAAFAVLERARTIMEETGQSFEAALTATRPGNLFTTHTSVAAGFDRFPPALMVQYLQDYAEDHLKIHVDDMLALGRENPHDVTEPFNMAYLAIRGSGAVNGVSRLHGKVSQRLFQHLYPRWPEREVPVGVVTNGIHVPTWDSAEADALWTDSCGQDRWLGTPLTLAEKLRSVPDSALWHMRESSRHVLIDYVRARVIPELAAAGTSSFDIAQAQRVLRPDTLTLGFARRFATYKRPNLLLHDPKRLLRLLCDSARPIQLLLAGKAHPYDQAGQDMIQEWTQFIRSTEARAHVVFLSDYDMLLAQYLVQGVDLWLNTPRRPWEASGTSGMKVLVNGGLNLSELDGWWAEAYTPEVGWALGDGQEHGDDSSWDAREADTLYTLLEEEILPAFYSRDDAGIPIAWVKRMRESMVHLTPRFSADRTVREYTERYYLPGATAYHKRAVDGGAGAAEVLDWQAALKQYWAKVRFGDLVVKPVGDGYRIEAEVYLGLLDPDFVRVELYADDREELGPSCEVMRRGPRLTESTSGFLYTAEVLGTRPVTDYTPRIVPYHHAANVPLEAGHIHWQR